MRLTSANGDVYVGQTRRGHMHGVGVLTFPTGGTLAGAWEAGAFGKDGGRETYPSGTTYVGTFVHTAIRGGGGRAGDAGDVEDGGPTEMSATRQGLGRCRFAPGGWLQGEWVKGQADGWGSFYGPDGLFYVGHFRGNQRHGPGLFRMGPNALYLGDLSDDGLGGYGAYWTRFNRMGSGGGGGGGGDDDEEMVDDVVYLGKWVKGRRTGVGVARSRSDLPTLGSGGNHGGYQYQYVIEVYDNDHEPDYDDDDAGDLPGDGSCLRRGVLPRVGTTSTDPRLTARDVQEARRVKQEALRAATHALTCVGRLGPPSMTGPIRALLARLMDGVVGAGGDGGSGSGTGTGTGTTPPRRVPAPDRDFQKQLGAVLERAAAAAAAADEVAAPMMRAVVLEERERELELERVAEVSSGETDVVARLDQTWSGTHHAR